MQRLLGGSIYGPFARGTNQPIYKWAVHSVEDIDRVMGVLWPHLSQRRRDQYHDVMELVAANPPIDPGAAWRTRRERFGPSGGNRRADLTPRPCGRGHDVSERYVYDHPAGRSYLKCHACDRENTRASVARRTGHRLDD